MPRSASTEFHPSPVWYRRRRLMIVAFSFGGLESYGGYATATVSLVQRLAAYSALSCCLFPFFLTLSLPSRLLE